ncbi:JmjC domain-containing protein [Endozoicomonas sp. ALD040]|uniref:JmjC domain-containing protein n=1 Tax=unclassified Endozoicomonas TaxID=2644528 RepID=UPI003BB13CD5
MMVSGLRTKWLQMLVWKAMALNNIDLYKLCRDFENSFFCKSNCNMYITPPNTQGLKAHYDTQDVIVLQIKGCKKWFFEKESTLYPMDNDYDDQHVEDIIELHSEVLTPGSILYLPRGCVHKALNEGDNTSIHLTISLTPYRKIHLLHAMLEQAVNNHSFLRKAVTLSDIKKTLSGKDTGSITRLVDSLNEFICNSIEKTEERILLDAALSLIKDIHDHQRTISINSTFEFSDMNRVVDHNSILTVCEDQNLFFSENENKIFYIGGEITIDQAHIFIKRLLLEKKVFKVSDIDSDDALNIADSLIKSGIVYLK